MEGAGSITVLTLSVSARILEIIGGSPRRHGLESLVGGEAGKNPVMRHQRESEDPLREQHLALNSKPEMQGAPRSKRDKGVWCQEGK